MKGGSLAILDADQSAALRDRLLGEIADIGSADQAASWARGVLTAKNSLTAADAKLVKDAFEQRLLRFSGSNGVGDLSGSDVVAAPSATKSRKVRTNAAAERSSGIDKSVLAVGAPRRYRNKDHLRFVAAQPCLICARKPSDPHHLRFMQPRALGRKVSDEFTVPLCRVHHRAVHRSSNEPTWWKAARIDPAKIARKLWRRTRLNQRAADGSTQYEGQMSPGDGIAVTG
jgi:hypothetical protein